MGIHQKESVSVEWGGRTLTIETGSLATQANGAVTVQYGETILLVTATMARVPAWRPCLPAISSHSLS